MHQQLAIRLKSYNRDGTAYGTAQLQGNICTRLERVQDASAMCVRCIKNVGETHLECTRDASVLVQNLVIKLQQDLWVILCQINKEFWCLQYLWCSPHIPTSNRIPTSHSF